MARALVCSNGPHPEEYSFSLNPNKSTSYLSLCLSMNFFNETSEGQLHQVLKPGILGFGQAQVLGES